MSSNDNKTSAEAAPNEALPKVEEIITPEVLASVIKGYKPDSNLKLLSFDAKLATKVGDNYFSVMYATDIRLEDPKTKHQETLHAMLKTIPRSEVRQEMINEIKMYHKETEIYRKLFPLLQKTQTELGLPTSIQFSSWPKSYASHVDGKTDYLAMENLRASGYKLGVRQLGLDFRHCSLVLQNLAQFHAISYFKFGGSREAILEAFPILKGGIIDKSHKNFFEQQKAFFVQSYKNQADLFRKQGEELVASRLEKLAANSNISEELLALAENKVKVAVISHGDVWTSNLMFGYEKDDEGLRFPTKVKFLDFQLSLASSRVLDIFYFLLTSCQLEVLEKAQKERDLLLIYYAEFTRFAQLLGVDTEGLGLTWEAFQEEVDRYRFHGVCLALLLTPMFMAESGDVKDMDTVTKEDMDNPEKNMKEMYEGMKKSKGFQKVKYIVLEQLPKCKGVDVERYL